ncbi:MAG: hypothetical protein JSS04_03805 [Proteobacteria bacterium]|nr:hypothetical protein [Pseudomonadota bacterium]
MDRPLIAFAQTPPAASPWAAAGHDTAAFGASLDRVYGVAGNLHVVQHFAPGDAPLPMVDDPLVLLGNLMDGLGLPVADMPHTPMPELAAVYDFAPDGLHLRDLWVHDPHG